MTSPRYGDTDSWPDPMGLLTLGIAEVSDESGLLARLIAHRDNSRAPLKSVELFCRGQTLRISAAWHPESAQPIQTKLQAIEAVMILSEQLSDPQRASINSEARKALVNNYVSVFREMAVKHQTTHNGFVSCNRHALETNAFRQSSDPNFKAALIDCMHASTEPYSLIIAAESPNHPGRVLILFADDEEPSAATYFDANVPLDGDRVKVLSKSCKSSEVASLFQPLSEELKVEAAIWLTQGEDTAGFVDSTLVAMYKEALNALNERAEGDLDLGTLKD